MNVLITGANGQLGNELRRLAAGSGQRFIFTDVNEAPGQETVYLDITNKDAVRIIARAENVDVIVNCAAYTNVDRAEDDPDMALLLNRTAVANLAEVAAECKASLIHISTDYVFPGTDCRPITEDRSPEPLGVYGATKLAGEREVALSGCRSIIIRTAWLYSPFGRNFVKTMLNLTEMNDTVKVVCDQVGTPTYAADLAGLIVRIISGNMLDRTGTYHFSNEGAVSWYDFAQAVNELGGHSCKVVPCLSGEFPSKAARPSYSVLDKSLVKSTFGIEIPYWRDSLKDCLKRM
ncbi:MAG: dTDP-4-dehydrorhamnose reductase [Bacteroidales bacterium]|nr:dTDP-4-dehydrorhamnose reductase [Bacteroidales bacterium]